MYYDITDEDFNISVMLLETKPGKGKDAVFTCAVSFNIATAPQTCILDYLDIDYILDLLEEPKEYALNGGRTYETE